MGDFVVLTQYVNRNLLTAIERTIVAQLAKAILNIGQINSIVRTRRTGNTALYLLKIKLEHLGISSRLALRVVPEALSLCIRFHQSNLLHAATSKFEVIKRFLVYREQSASCTIFGRHV